jgi:polyphenol oxidase
MGKGSGAAGQRGTEKVQERRPEAIQISETPIEGPVPRFEIRAWRKEYGVVAGITGRGMEAGRGFDLGLWSREPVGEVMSRWRAFRRELSDFPGVALGNQVHGVEVMTAESASGWMQVEGVDGWITTAPGILLTVTVADCIPVYLVAPDKGVGLLHAGWRGTAAGILKRGVERLVEATGCSVGHIVMHTGVGICGRCYEVGSEVMNGCGVPAEGSGPWHIDLREQLAQQAERLGITAVTSSTWCSAHDRSSFYSHRASGGTDGRMVVYVGMPLGASGSLVGSDTDPLLPSQRTATD